MATFLILAIVFNTFFAAFYKIAVRKQCNLEAVNLWMYIGAAFTMAAWMLIRGDILFSRIALGMGLAAGFMAFFSTLSFFHHMKKGQISASWTVISLAVGFPVVASIFAWHEIPTSRQTVGLVLIVVALLLFGRHETTNGSGEKR